MNPNVAPETQFVGQPAPEVPPQPSIAGYASAQTPDRPFSITGLATDERPQTVGNPDTQPGSASIPTAFTEYKDAPPGTYPQAEGIPEAPTPAPEPIPAEFVQHATPPIAEVPTATQFTPEAQVAQPQPVKEVPPSATPWTETTPPLPLPTEPVVGLSPDAAPTPAPIPQTPSEAAVLQSMEPGNAGLIANNKEPLGVAIAEAAQAEIPTPKIPVTELLSNSDKKDIIPAPIEEVIENGKKGLSLVEGTKLEGPFLEGFAGGVAISTGYKKAA